MKTNPLIVAAARSSVVPYGGAFCDINFEQLAVPPIHACLKQVNIKPSEVDNIIVSNALGAGGNPARVVSLATGLPITIAGISIDAQCAGGLDAILIAEALILSGKAKVVIAGGTESYSLRPKRYFKTKFHEKPVYSTQARFTPWKKQDPNMHEAAHQLAIKYGITKDEQDDWAITSHVKALAAQKQLMDEIVNPLEGFPKHDPFNQVLTKKICNHARILSGTITTANTAHAADGAAFVLLMSEELRNTLKINHTMRIIESCTIGSDPQYPGIAPVYALQKIFKNRSIHKDTMTIELMEAYASQAIACIKTCQLPVTRTNVSGGALSRGHPIGASGTILMVRLFQELKKTQGQGIATIASAGGIGTAIMVEAS